MPTDVSDPEAVRALFAQTKERVRPARPPVQQRRHRRRPVPLEDLTRRAVAGGRRRQPDRRVPVHAGSVQAHEGARTRAAGASSTTARSRRTRRGPTRRRTPPRSTRSPGSPSRPPLDGRKYDIACGQIDIGNAATEMTARDGQGRAAGERRRSRSSRRWTWSTSPARCVYMASLPLDANVLFMTVMATKMPFVGRG